MKQFLKQYEDQGFISKESIGFDQIQKHLDRAKQDLTVAKANLQIDLQASYTYAYLAMLRTGRALMFSFGYRPKDGQQHKTVVLFAEYVLGQDFSILVEHFNQMRKKRNKFTYTEPGLSVTKEETQNSLVTAKEFVTRVSQFIQEKNPQKTLLN